MPYHFHPARPPMSTAKKITLTKTGSLIPADEKKAWNRAMKAIREQAEKDKLPGFE